MAPRYRAALLESERARQPDCRDSRGDDSPSSGYLIILLLMFQSLYLRFGQHQACSADIFS